ncbi:Hemolysin-type calcium-binding repeat-containing protein [Aromatoleum tolulyticum]|uniref:Hemolysin-type calcium-binding repeat-containing protein n=1 Tax=Aromatoleum tolulyticum TaxID=34027 RepID=A0A1N6SV53_9RHOO|nr:hypothetical protein [Aromatoleum tolulyticum]SIQ44766.1 Hemolysin-type calcium-binding repeat-containing protein [Aromatoleum tolulyticum]
MAMHFYYNGHTYEIETAPLTWDDASANALSLAWNDEGRLQGAGLGGPLIVPSYLSLIGSAAENAAILKNLKPSVPKGATVATDGGNASYLWLGASDVQSEGSWQWLDGTLLGSGYQNWGSGSLGGEPDNFGGVQDFLAIATGKWPAPAGGLGAPGQWNDLDGANLLWSVVEWDGLIGTTGNDKLTGTAGDDVIDGNAGNDTVKAGDGDDIIYMGTGDDNVQTGNGSNAVFAEIGLVDDNDGNDRVTGGSGDDFIAPGTGNDNVRAGDGNNVVIGGSGDDIITTGAGNDTIDPDVYYAEDGVEASGNDTIKTGAGDDVIFLGEGADKVWGGAGSDTFVFDTLFTAPSTTVFKQDGTQVTKATVHRINDFDATVDKLGFDANEFVSLAGFTATNFVKGSGLTGASANETGVDDFLIYDTASGKLYYDEDGNHAGAAPVLLGVVTGRMADLDASDIVIFA